MPSSGGHSSKKINVRAASPQTGLAAKSFIKQTTMEVRQMDIGEQFAAIGAAMKKVVQDSENANKEMQKTVAEVRQVGLQAAEEARRDSQSISEQTRKEAAAMLQKLGDDLNKYATREEMDKLTSALNTFSKGTRARLDSIESAIFETDATADKPDTQPTPVPVRKNKLDSILAEIKAFSGGLHALEQRVSVVERKNAENGQSIANAAKNIAEVLALLQKQFAKA